MTAAPAIIILGPSALPLPLPLLQGSWRWKETRRAGLLLLLTCCGGEPALLAVWGASGAPPLGQPISPITMRLPGKRACTWA